MSEPESLCWGDDIVTEDVLVAPTRVFARRPRHAGAILLEGRRRAEDVYLVEDDRRLTFAEHDSAVAAVRAHLESAGVRRGDRVMIVGANRIEFIVSFWAILRAGAVAVVGNAWWSAAELHAAMDSTAPSCIIADERRAELLGAGLQYLSFNEIRRLTQTAAPRPDSASTPVCEDDPALIVFTSETTGYAKAAELSHRSVVSTLQNFLAITGKIPRNDVPPGTGSANLLSLPLFHIGGVQQITIAMATGGRLVFCTGRFDPARVVSMIAQERVRAWAAVPSMVTRVSDHLEKAGMRLPDLRTISMGGGPVSEQVRERARAVFPHAHRGIGVTWGLTESGGAVTSAVGPDVVARPGTVGRLLPTCEVRVQAPDDGRAGELLVRSPSVMRRYLGDVPSPVDADRWLHTGDIGWVDDDSFVYITDRAKDIVIRGGENVAAAHVEAAIMHSDAVAEAAVVGLPHADLGEEVGAVIVTRAGQHIDVENLRSRLHQWLAHFEVPIRWWIRVKPLPRNATGKILKPIIRSEWIAELKHRHGTEQLRA
jgi:long-chain acyl-CoA synthetase